MRRLIDGLTPGQTAFIVWLLTSIVLLAAYWHNIWALATVDPDDALRLVQVRDLIGGQAWWDVSQHRINPAGGGGLMHWSRLVDAPLATGIIALTPLVGQRMAESIVTGLWPLCLLGALFAIAARCFTLVGGRAIGIAATALIATDYIILYQFVPVRIDHHGWQIMLTLGIIYHVLKPASTRNGAIAGVLGALLLAISLEGLPAIALAAGIMAVVWVCTPDGAAEQRLGRGQCLSAFLVTLALTAIIVQFVTRGPGALMMQWCDSLSLPYFGALAMAAIGVTALVNAPARVTTSPLLRLSALGIIAGASGATLLLIEPACARGPFGMLDPLVVHYWYSKVREGLPIWVQFDYLSISSIAPTLLGFIGTLLAWRNATDAEARHRWLLMLALVSGLGLLSILVLRTGSIAHVASMPGLAYLLIRMWTWARGLTSAVPRILATVAACIAVPAIGGGAAALITESTLSLTGHPLKSANSTTGVGHPTTICVDPASAAVLNRLPATTLFTPLDIGPHLLQWTHHSVVATGHHRNNRVMAKVIAAFIGPSDRAEAIVRSVGATMVVICPRAPEINNLRDAPGTGLADDLTAGRTPRWLQPVAMPAHSGLQAWRVTPAPH